MVQQVGEAAGDHESGNMDTSYEDGVSAPARPYVVDGSPFKPGIGTPKVEQPKKLGTMERFRRRRASTVTTDDAGKRRADLFIDRFVRGFGTGGGDALEKMLGTNMNKAAFSHTSDLVNMLNYDRVPPYMIKPDASWKLGWDLTGLFLIVFYMFIVPMRLAFSDTVPKRDVASFEFLNGLGFWFALDIMSDFFFLADIAMNFRLAERLKTGELETDWKILARKYLSGWFFFDLIASMPLSLIAPSDGNSSGSLQKVNKLLRVFRVFKLLRLFRLPRLMKGVERNKLFSPSFFRLVRLGLVYFIVVHYIANFYWIISKDQGFCQFQSAELRCIGSDPTKACHVDDSDAAKQNQTLAFYRWGGGVPRTVVVDGEEKSKNILFQPNGYYDCVGQWTPWVQILNENFATQYSQAFFWAMMVTTGIGHDIQPQTDAETWYTIFGTIMGVFLYAFIIGSVPAALEHLDAGKFEHRNMLDKINDFLSNQHVPAYLRKDVNEYFDFIQLVNSKGGSHTFSKVLAPLPDSMKLRVKVSLNWKYLRDMDLFSGISPTAGIKIIELLKPHVATPGEHLIVQGSKGGIMFLIKTGRVMLKHESGALMNWKQLSQKVRRKIASESGLAAFNFDSLHQVFNNHDDQTVKMLMNYAEDQEMKPEERTKNKSSTTTVLTAGSFVGENIAIGNAHNHSAIALEFCDLLVLTKEKLDEVFRLHGSVRARMMKTIKSRSERVASEKRERRQTQLTHTGDKIIDVDTTTDAPPASPVPLSPVLPPAKTTPAVNTLLPQASVPMFEAGTVSNEDFEELQGEVRDLQKGQEKIVRMIERLLGEVQAQRSGEFGHRDAVRG